MRGVGQGQQEQGEADGEGLGEDLALAVVVGGDDGRRAPEAERGEQAEARAGSRAVAKQGIAYPGLFVRGVGEQQVGGRPESRGEHHRAETVTEEADGDEHDGGGGQQPAAVAQPAD